ncbi:putative Isoprenylcysteine carboxyl methyltransferase [Verrucomicrobia bacterium]|nr:putative Isoprenylcysteine carboxyl methyltransferase [Verrucomicrobiota bacterium]
MLNPLSVIGYLVMVGGMLGLIFTHNLFSAALPVLVAQVAAVGLMVWARITFGRRSFHFGASPTQGELVTAGPYRFIRHPIYSAVCLFVTAGVGAHLSWKSGLLGALVWAGALIRIVCEERMLREHYPAYQQYAGTTARMIPGLF